MKFRTSHVCIIQQPLNASASFERIVKSFVRANVVVLQVHQGHARIIPSAAFPIHVRFNQLFLRHPIEFTAQLHGIAFECIQNGFPSHQNVLGRGRQFTTRVEIMRGTEVGTLDGNGIGHASARQLQVRPHGQITGDDFDRRHRIIQDDRGHHGSLIQHVRDDRRGSDFQVRGQFRHVGVTHDDVQAPESRGIRMWLIACIDQGPPDHRVEISHAFKKIRALRNLIRRGSRPVLRADFSGPGEDEARHEKRHQRLNHHVEGHGAGHQIILMVAVTVPFPIGIILVGHVHVSPCRLIHGVQARGGNPLTCALIRHQFSCVTTFGSRILRMGTVDVQPAGVRQQLVDDAVIFRPRAFAFTFHLKTSSVYQGVLVLVVPDGPGNGEHGIITDQSERIFNGV